MTGGHPIWQLYPTLPYIRHTQRGKPTPPPPCLPMPWPPGIRDLRRSNRLAQSAGTSNIRSRRITLRHRSLDCPIPQFSRLAADPVGSLWLPH